MTTGATNGLSIQGNNIVLGGTLTGDTTILIPTGNTLTLLSMGDSINSISINENSINLLTNNTGCNFSMEPTDIQLGYGSATKGSLLYFDDNGILLQALGTHPLANDDFSQLLMKPTGVSFYFAPNIGVGGFALTNFINSTQGAIASGLLSFAMGQSINASGKFSFAGGKGSGTRIISATGQTSFNFSENDAGQTVGHGALATESFILGGKNHNIPKLSLRSGILGGNTIKAANGVTDTVYMPKVRIGRGTSGSLSTLITGNTSLLGYVSTTGEIGTSRVANGLTYSNGMLSLGGTLTGATTITDVRSGVNAKGVQYGADYSANFSPRSLVDKGFVTGLTNSLLTKTSFNTYTGTTVVFANNGLTKSGNNIHLGGALTGVTTLISTSANTLIFSGWPIQYSTDLSLNYNVRSLVDKGFVTGITSTFKNPIKGSFIATGISTTVFTVTIGSTMGNISYIVQPVPTSAIATIGHYITNKTVTSFDVVYTLPITGPITFDWVITP